MTAPKKPAPRTVSKKDKHSAPVVKTSAGFAAIIGAPNAGKSTLLNQLVGQKISIVSPKAQTTRSRVLGIVTDDETQICLIDTPGIFAPKRRLDRAMVDAAWQSLDDADIVVWLRDATEKVDEDEERIIAELQKRSRRVTLALNKIDAIALGQLLPLAERLNASGVVTDIFMISALKGDGVADLKDHLKAAMPKGPWLFPEDQISDLPVRLLAAEMTREQLYRQLQQELPYVAAVIPETWETKKDGSSVIHQIIVVARDNHKPIVLGKGGSRIKAIGEAARRDIERFLGTRAHLFLNVKVDEKWQERSDFYQLFGLSFDAGPHPQKQKSKPNKRKKN
jgi:GTP-binding protein Era